MNDLIKAESLTPLPGYAYLDMDSYFRKYEGGIYIPQISRRRIAYQGMCFAFTNYNNGPHANDKWPEDMVGQICMTTAGTGQILEGVDKRLMRIELRHVVAVIDPEGEAVEDLKLMDGSYIERCRWCKSKGEGNMMLGPDGYCIRCKRDNKGEFKPGVDIADHREAMKWMS